MHLTGPETTTLGFCPSGKKSQYNFLLTSNRSFGFWLIIYRRFGVAWISKERISAMRFHDLRVKDNVEGLNNSSLVTSCRDGAEVSQYCGTQMLRIFQAIQEHVSPTTYSQFVTFEDSWTILISRQSYLKISVKLQTSITLENNEGDYSICMSSDGKYIAGGSRIVEVFVVETGRLLWAFNIRSSDDDEIHTARFNKNATQLATAGEKGIIYVSKQLFSGLCNIILDIISNFEWNFAWLTFESYGICTLDSLSGG